MEFLYTLITFACVANVEVKSELFTSLAHLQSAQWAERELAEIIRHYVTVENERLKELKLLADDFEKHSKEAEDSPKIHIANPVNAYLFTKRFTLDWDKNTEDILSESVADDGATFKATVEEIKKDLPTYEDLQGAVEALLRLQDTYELDTHKLARGDIRGIQTAQLSDQDCFEIGRIAYDTDDFYHSLLWMEETISRYNKTINNTFSKEEALECLSFSYYQEGNVTYALSLTDELLTLVPNHERAKSNKEYYVNMIQKEEKATQQTGEDKSNQNKEEDSVENNQEKEEEDDDEEEDKFANYEKLCRGENTQNITNAHKLKCRYRRSHPSLYLSPAKEETVYINPDIFIYHDVMSDSEAETIKDLSMPRLERAKVVNPHTKEGEIASYRISKSAFLLDDDHEVVHKVNNRIGAITGLSMETAEPLQIANYGIGGHYSPHLDFSEDNDDDLRDKRIATWLTYMTDVPAGGATVFPEIGVKLWPKKGTAAFWYNLYKNGRGIYKTGHAACPVLVGVKWVSNKWIHERGQEFRRPCGLKANE